MTVVETGSDELQTTELAVVADEFGALVVGDDAALTAFAEEWDGSHGGEISDLTPVRGGTTLGVLSTALLATTAPVARYAPGPALWAKSKQSQRKTVVTIHRMVRSTGKIVSNKRIAPVAAVPGIAPAVLATLAVETALEQFAARIMTRLDDIENQVDDVLRLAAAQRLGDVYGHRRILQRRVRELDSGVVLTDTDWSSIAALGADLEVGVERLRHHAMLLTEMLDPEESADKRADQLESVVHKGRLQETLKLLLIAQQSLYLWQRLRLARTQSSEPDHLEQTTDSARATLREHLDADRELADRLRDALDRHAVLRVAEVHRQLAGRKLAKNRKTLSHTVDSFIEARALQIGSWSGTENATIREAWTLAVDRTLAATNSGRRQLSAGATAVARWVEPKEAPATTENSTVPTATDTSTVTESADAEGSNGSVASGASH